MATKENNSLGNGLEETMSKLHKAILAEFEVANKIFEETKAAMTLERFEAMMPEKRESIKSDLAVFENYVQGLKELIEKHNIKTNINN